MPLIEKIPPQNVDAEQQILGAVLLEPDSLLVSADIISPTDFYNTSHRILYETLLDLYDLGEPLDIISITERLKTKDLLEEVGGTGYLTSIISNTPTSANIGYHSRIVREKSIARQITCWAMNIAETVPAVEDFPAWLGTLETELIDISLTCKDKTSPYFHDIMSAIETDWQSVREGKRICVKASDLIDRQIPGYYPHLWMISGYTSVGKSLTLGQLIVDACQEGARVVLFTNEESRKEKMLRLISIVSNIPYKTLLVGRISGLEEKIEEAKKEIESWNIIIYENTRNVDDIRLKVKKHKLKDGIDIFCLDYVQNLTIEKTLYETMADAAVKLFAMTREMSVTGWVVSQIDNESARKPSQLIGLKGAGELAAVADIVIWLSRVKNQERHLEFAIKKNRPFGDTGTIEMMFNDRWTGIMHRSLSF